MHIRAGIFPSGIREGHEEKQPTAGEWKKTIECALDRSKALGVTGPIILVTDSMQCKRWVSKRYDRVLTSSVSPLHIAMDTNSWNDAMMTEEKTKHYQSVLANTAELALLSDAAVVVMSQSGFSCVGVWLGGLSANDTIYCLTSCSKKLVFPS